MSFIAPLKEKLRNFSPQDLVYYLFPVLLIVILYYSFLPFNQTYIGEWHDIFANTMYYQIVDQNYFLTWSNLWSGGLPLTANPGGDKYYILSFPFYLIFQNLSVVNFLILFHLIIGYFAFFKLGSLLTKNLNALLVFSLFFTFSGMLFGRIYAGHHLLLFGLVWLPLLYYFFFKIVLFNEPGILNCVGLSVTAALVYFTGNVYHFVLAFLIILVFFIYYAVDKKISKKVLYYLALSLVILLLLVSVKSIPDLNVSGSIIRNDVIDPLAGGGSLENGIASFVLGTGIDTLWAQYESGILIGIIPLLLAVFALLYGRREITVPSFFAILASVIWADGGKTLVSFIHFLPVVSSFRNPGRIYGALLPIILFLALYGTILLSDKLKKGETFDLSHDQRRMVIFGLGLLVVVKILELPFQEMITAETAISVILVLAFIALLYLGKGSERTIQLFFLIALLINAAVLLRLYSFVETDVLIRLLFIGLLFIGLFLFIQKAQGVQKSSRVFCGLLIAGLFLMVMGNVGCGYVKVYSPELDKSVAPAIIQEITRLPNTNTQLWVYETGWAIQHMDFTYWDVVNNIHPVSAYAAYYLNTVPQLTYMIGNVSYYSVDYIIDTRYLDNGNQNLPAYSFKVQNISVYRPEHVLPNAFFIRDDQLYPLKIEKFSPDEVIASGQLKSGDVVILKGAFYNGWKVNGADAVSVNNFIGAGISQDTRVVRFVFDPADYKMGALITAVGIILIVILIFKRKTVEEYLEKNSREELPEDIKDRRKQKR
ncbi:hypothetical protein [Methanoregula sp.]|uniref:hypothetical protein n=1 Tax=Methanoregula sp. TaxID=2052170 RepID=UPI00356A2766